MKSIRRLLACLLCLIFLAAPALAEKSPVGYQAAHRFTMKKIETTVPNGATVWRWTITTSNERVTEAVNAIAKAFQEEMKGSLKKPGSTSNENSKLTVSIIPSRTGLTWMSFMIQARVVYHQKTVDVRFETRTYDMLTGEAVTLADVFPQDSAAWQLLSDRVRAQIDAYYPALTAPADAVDAACAVGAIADMPFTLHGMRLLLHLNAADFYPGHPQLIQIPLYYPEIRSLMTDRAQTETANETYYNVIALTVDDGPNGWVTDRILQELMCAGEPATFFLVGERMRQQAFHVQRQHDEGHGVATHNYVHVYASSTPASQLQSLRDKANAVHEEVIGLAPAYCRAPGGQWQNMASANLGWPLIQWTVEAQDWSGDNGPEPTYTAGNIVAGSYDGGVILMHDLKQNSIEAIRLILQRLQDKGYIFLTVEELFSMHGVTLQPDTAYWCNVDGVTEKQ